MTTHDARVSDTFSVITGNTIQTLIHEDIAGCIRTIEEAYLAHDSGLTVNPPSVFLRFPDRPKDRIIALPAHLSDSRQVSGLKWISSYPENTRAGIPRASAVLILNECKHGRPFACLEGSVISAARTAASAVLAARSLHSVPSQKVHSAGFIGTGLIARNILLFMLRTGWHINTLHLFDSDRRSQLEFAEWVRSEGFDTDIVHDDDIGSTVRECEMAVFATVAGRPHVTDLTLFGHHPTVLHISVRDLSPEIVLASNNIVDDAHHALTADTSLHLAEKQTGNRDFVTGSLADILLCRRAPSSSKPTIFSPFGLGMLDVALGKWVYDRAIASGKHLSVGDFFVTPTAA